MRHLWNPRKFDSQRAILAAGCLGAGVALATFLGSGGLAAQRAGRSLPVGTGDQTGPLWTLATPLEDGRQMLLVVDQQNRAMAIYHVRWDLMVEDFNAQEPKPAALKKMLEMPK